MSATPDASDSHSGTPLLDAIPHPTLLVDGDGRILHANAAAADLLCRPAESLRGTPVGCTHLSRAVDATGGAPAMSERPLDDGSGRRVVSLHRSPTAAPPPSADPVAALDQIGFWRVDLESRAVFWSETVYRIHGRNRATFRPTVETSVAQYHPDDRPRIERVVAAALASGEPFAFAARIVRADGSVREVTCSGVAETSGSGERIGMSGVIQDMTELAASRAEVDAQIRANQILREAIENAEDAICVYDAQDVFVTANRQYFKLYPYLRDEAYLAGRTFEDVLRISLANRVIRNARALDDPDGYVRDRMIDRNLGRPMPERQLSDGRWYLIKERRTPGGYTITRRVDITDRKLAEIALGTARDEIEARAVELERLAVEADLARRQAEEASSARSRFLATMSHELRTPMTGLLAVIDLFGRHPLDEERQRLLSTMRGSAEHLLELLDDILDFSKFEADCVALEPAPFRPDRLAAQVMDLFSSRIADRGLQIRVEIDPALPPVLVGDLLRLRQLLANLVSNAVKFTPSGTITVTLAADSVADGICRMRGTVSDTGIGIPPDVAPDLFDAFRQGDASTTRRYGGTGLGLAICKRIVTAMDGEIDVDSTVGAGSTFRFSVPLPVGDAAPEGEDETAPGDMAEPSTRSLSILLAEDNDTNRMLIAQYLAGEGHRVTEAVNGREAVDAVDAAPFDVVLMDMQMPVMDGDEATRRIRAGPRPRIPIIAVTADAIPSHHATYRRAGVDDVVTKPIDWPALRLRLQRIAGAESTLASATTARPPAVVQPGPSPGPFDLPLFDRSYVMRTLGVIAHERVLPLLSELPPSISVLIDALAAAAAADDPGAARRAAHSLKGTAANFGALRLAALAGAVETTCAAGSVADAEIEMLRHVAKTTVDALGDVERWLTAPRGR